MGKKNQTNQKTPRGQRPLRAALIVPPGILISTNPVSGPSSTMQLLQSRDNCAWNDGTVSIYGALPRYGEGNSVMGHIYGALPRYRGKAKARYREPHARPQPMSHFEMGAYT